ncbi:MAG TPA: dethiobiotin synthase [Ferruginibacter sp.]|nr:dethiobiotin synthase [Ferruginibacter sp.]
MSIIIAGIHTGIGKTVCSAVICQSLGYDYWKPVQAGDWGNSDSVFIKKNVTNPKTLVHPETYKLVTAASPHYAAKLDGIEIMREHIQLPRSKNNIVVETAGGLMSPLAKGFLNIDLVEQLQLPVVLVSNNYLGSINHTLLSYEALQNRKITIAGIVFDGETVTASQEFIVEYIKLPVLFSIPQFPNLNARSISEFAATISIKL